MGEVHEILPPTAQPRVIDQVLALPVASIEMGERLRPVDPAHAEALAAVIRKDGQDTPIEVCRLPGRPGWLLVTGAHRLAAHQLLDAEAIKAVVVSAERAERRRKEIAENLFRRGLDPIDRAAFVAELYALEKARAGLDPASDPRAAGANARWAKVVKEQATDANDTMSLAYGFSERAAEQLGFNVRTLQRDLELHRGLPAALVARIRGLPIASNAGQLRALAKLAPDDQRAVVDRIAEGRARGVADARAQLAGNVATATPETKRLNTFLGAYDRMSTKERAEALAMLARRPTPQGFQIITKGKQDA